MFKTTLIKQIVGFFCDWWLGVLMAKRLASLLTYWGWSVKGGSSKHFGSLLIHAGKEQRFQN